MLVCYVGFYGEKHRPCQTLSSTRSEKKEKSMCKDGRGGEGNLSPRIQRVWIHGEDDATDRKYICSRLKNSSKEAALLLHKASVSAAPSLNHRSKPRPLNAVNKLKLSAVRRALFHQ